jgi:hypothetical protein
LTLVASSFASMPQRRRSRIPWSHNMSSTSLWGCYRGQWPFLRATCERDTNCRALRGASGCASDHLLGSCSTGARSSDAEGSFVGLTDGTANTSKHWSNATCRGVGQLLNARSMPTSSCARGWSWRSAFLLSSQETGCGRQPLYVRRD